MKTISIIFMFLATIASLGGCQWNVGMVSEGEEFSLNLGEKAIVRGEGLSIVFADILEDSRCPTGAQCIWQGQVRCAVLLSKSGSTYTETFIQPGLTSEPASESALGYVFTFRVEPYPQAGGSISLKDYRLILSVTEP